MDFRVSHAGDFPQLREKENPHSCAS
jgi:hypothetical protein